MLDRVGRSPFQIRPEGRSKGGKVHGDLKIDLVGACFAMMPRPPSANTALFLLFLLASHAADALRTSSLPARRCYPPSIDRRRWVVQSTLAAAAALAPLSPSEATPPTFVSGKQRQGLGQFVRGFNTAIIAGDVTAVQDALKLFEMDVDAETAQVAIESSKLPVSKIASGNLPVIVETRSGLTSTKVTMRVEGASMTKDNFVKLLYLRNADTKDVITCRELTKLSEKPEMVQASLPKGLRVEPVVWCNRGGVFVGEAVMT